MTRITIDVAEADLLLAENAAKHAHIPVDRALGAVVATWAEQHRRQLRGQKADSAAVAEAVRAGAARAEQVAGSSGAGSAVRLTDEEVARMRTLLDQGETVAAVARRFGVHYNTVRYRREQFRAEDQRSIDEGMHAEAMRKEKAEWD